MKQPDSTSPLTSPMEAKPTARKPYQKPAVRYERVFETSALACTKVQTTERNCHATSKKAS